MKIIKERSLSVLTEYGRYRLTYELLESNVRPEEDSAVYYGMRISQTSEENSQLFDRCLVRGITEEIGTARDLFLRAVEGLVMPTSLWDFIDDWQASFTMV